MTDVNECIDKADEVYEDDLLQHNMEAMKKQIPVRGVMTPDCLTVHPNDDFVRVAQLMKDHRVTCVVVTEDGKVVGILTQMDLIRHLVATSGRITGKVQDCMSSSVISVYGQQSIWEATEVLEKHRIKRLPVMEEGSLVGIVTQTNLIHALYACGSYKEVDAIMNTEVSTVAPEDRVYDAVKKIAQYGFSCLVVCEDCEDKNPVGLVSEHDLLERVIAVQKDPNQLFVRDIMTTPLIAIDSHFSIHSAACLMEQKHIHRLVVQEDGELKGIITRTDIFKAALQSMEMEKAMACAYQEIKKVESQLIQNEKLASIGQMAAGVAHEMNTPVGFVSSNFLSLRKYMDHFLELFQMYEELGKAVEDGNKDKRLEISAAIQEMRQRFKIDFVLQDIGQLFSDSEEGLQRINEIVQNLRNFSRIDQVDQLDEYDMNQGIKSSLMVARNAIKYDADVKLDLNEVPIIQGNGGQINQVILNICVNAAQAIKGQAREDRGTIKIKTYSTDDFIVCEIRDDGPGIAPEHLQKIFDPFYTTKPVGLGTGLGLSVSHDIVVNKHHGQLQVETEMGKGTTFTIKLPVKQPLEQRDEETADDNDTVIVS